FSLWRCFRLCWQGLWIITDGPVVKLHIDVQVALAVDGDLTFHGSLARLGQPVADCHAQWFALVVWRKGFIPACARQHPVVAAALEPVGRPAQVQLVAGYQVEFGYPL